MTGRLLQRLVRRKGAMLGLGFILLSLAAGLFAPQFAPHDPYQVDVTAKLLGPSAEYPLGTDQLGRCILSRLIYGTRVSLASGLGVTALILAIGVPLGLAAGYLGGIWGDLIMRLTDIATTLPSSMLALALVGIYGPSLHLLAVVFVCLWWAPFARLVRSQVVKVKEYEFVLAAVAAGSGRTAIIMKHITPNILPPVIVYATLRVAAVITHVAGFSFIGLGSQPPTADWGVMLSDGRQYLTSEPLMLLWPGLAITLNVLALNIFGEALGEAFQPTSEETAIVKEGVDE